MQHTMSPGGKRSSIDPLRSTENRLQIPRWLLIALAVLLPFEAPILGLGPLTITTVELVLYALLITWAIGFFTPARITGNGRGPWRTAAAETRVKIASLFRDPVALAVALWLAVILISALGAPAHRLPALKFALRALAGGALFFVARNLVRSAADTRAVAVAILIGAVISAVGAIGEVALPTTAALWRPFRTTTFSVTGLPRPSGPLGYPTIAAMYWEAALSLAVAVPMTKRDPSHQPGWKAVAAAIAAAMVLIAAILFSATRTALAVAVLASVAMAVLNWNGGRALRVTTGGTLALVTFLAATMLGGSGADSPLAMRLRWWQDGNWYRVSYTVPAGPVTMSAGSVVKVAVGVKNTGALMWPHTGPDAVRLSYHWEKQGVSGPRLDFEGRRSSLPADIAPGANARVVATVQAPEEPGRYRLRWDLVRETVVWFSERGGPTGDQIVEVTKVDVRASQRGRSEMIDSTLEDWIAPQIPTRSDLWQAALRLWHGHPLLGVGPDNFRRLYPEVISLVRNPTASYDERTHANSLYFETLADQGIAGILALAVLIAAVGRAAWRRLGVAVSPLTAALAVALGTFFVHGVLDCFLAFTPTYGLYWLLMALLVGPPEAPTRTLVSEDSKL
jgi:hypothetical protein